MKTFQTAFQSFRTFSKVLQRLERRPGEPVGESQGRPEGARRRQEGPAQARASQEGARVDGEEELRRLVLGEKVWSEG